MRFGRGRETIRILIAEIVTPARRVFRPVVVLSLVGLHIHDEREGLHVEMSVDVCVTACQSVVTRIGRFSSREHIVVFVDVLHRLASRVLHVELHVLAFLARAQTESNPVACIHLDEVLVLRRLVVLLHERQRVPRIHLVGTMHGIERFVGMDTCLLADGDVEHINHGVGCLGIHQRLLDDIVFAFAYLLGIVPDGEGGSAIVTGIDVHATLVGSDNTRGIEIVSPRRQIGA